MKYSDPALEAFNKKIHEVEKSVHHKEIELEKDDSKFEGIALISFLTEDMKRAVISSNPCSLGQLYQLYKTDGKYNDGSTMSWDGRKLLISEAPEPNGIDWNNIHAKMHDRVIGTIKSYIYSALFMTFLFFLLWGISIWKTNILKEITAETAAGQASPTLALKATIMTSAVSWVIVLFNKFVIGVALKQFVLMEKIDNKTSFNISMAKKVTVAVFINTCILVYIIEIIINDNIIGNGGFIQAETAVFVSNAWFTIAVWVIDPWSIDKSNQRNRIRNGTDPKPVTQQEANLLMECTDYSQAKRYSDIMKTMWFTFFYGDAIPIGIAINLVTLIVYYWVDKYNVLRRRTIKDTISSDLSNEMIHWLGFILILHAIGQISMTYGVYHAVPWQQYFVLFISIVYVFLPLDQWTRKAFPDSYKENDESLDYEQVKPHFETDYDRENPITRTFALKQWQIFHDQLAEKAQNQRVHNLEKQEGYKANFG